MDKDLVKVLIVDDEPDILEFLSYNLKKEKYDVYTAPNGKIGIDVALKVLPDLIILDIMMPEMDGIEVCRKLRSMPQFISTSIAFLTARNEDYTQIAALDYGGDDYITKPIKPGVFLSRIKALLRRSERIDIPVEEQIIQVGDLIIDREQFIVKRNDEVIELAKKEFNLIELLVSKPGKVFTRDEIFRKVWGTDVIVGNRTIDVHIRKLREKIGEDIIKTVKGIGYKFEF
jgi:two-component system alkaline phosphatase synthesis response regulator PhoP